MDSDVNDKKHWLAAQIVVISVSLICGILDLLILALSGSHAGDGFVFASASVVYIIGKEQIGFFRVWLVGAVTLLGMIPIGMVMNLLNLSNWASIPMMIILPPLALLQIHIVARFDGSRDLSIYGTTHESEDD